MVEKIKIMSHSCHKERKRICLDVCFKKITTAERFISVQTNIHLIVYLLYQSWTLLGFEGKQQKEKKLKMENLEQKTCLLIFGYSHILVNYYIRNIVKVKWILVFISKDPFTFLCISIKIIVQKTSSKCYKDMSCCSIHYMWNYMGNYMLK